MQSASTDTSVVRSRARRKVKGVAKRRRAAKQKPDTRTRTPAPEPLASALVRTIAGSGASPRRRPSRLTAERLFAILAPHMGAAMVEVLEKSDLTDRVRQKLLRLYRKLPLVH